MKQIYLIILILVTSLLYFGCDDDVIDPGGGQVGENTHPYWDISKPAVIVNDEIRVVNSGDTLNFNGSATSWQAFEFKDVSLVTFTWLFYGNSDTLVNFSVVNSSGTKTDLPKQQVNEEGVYRAQLQFFGDFREPIRFRFEFFMAPHTEARVSNFRYYME